jgi:hypothetical protein
VCFIFHLDDFIKNLNIKRHIKMKTEENDKGENGVADMSLLVGKVNNEPSSYEQREILRADYKWIASKEEILREKYLNMYVAVKNKKVVCVSNNVYKLLDDLKNEGISTSNIAIKYLGTNPTCFLL